MTFSSPIFTFKCIFAKTQSILKGYPGQTTGKQSHLAKLAASRRRNRWLYGEDFPFPIEKGKRNLLNFVPFT